VQLGECVVSHRAALHGRAEALRRWCDTDMTTRRTAEKEIA